MARLPWSNAPRRSGTHHSVIESFEQGEKMKKWVLAATAAAVFGLGTSAQAADKLTLQLKWVTQAQFAGYYVAEAKGFYKEAGLEVTIKPGGPDINPSQVIAGGGADVVVDWMPSALATREKGVALVNIAQTFTRSGMMLTCRVDSGIKTPADLKGKILGVWFSGNEYPFLSWMDKLGYKTSGPGADVTVLKQGFNVDPLLQKQAACISTMTYNEYWQLIEAGMKPDELLAFKYEEQGVATLEDGLYTLEPKLKDPASVERLARFVKASMKGWQYAIDHQDEAVKIVLDNDAAGVQTEAHQKRMMGEIAKLISGGGKGLGYLDEAAYQRTVQILMSGKSDPVISKPPAGAWTHAVWDKSVGG
jgi:NitT/TauT family transport system substrate-binding protein